MYCVFKYYTIRYFFACPAIADVLGRAREMSSANSTVEKSLAHNDTPSSLYVIIIALIESCKQSRRKFQTTTPLSKELIDEEMWDLQTKLQDLLTEMLMSPVNGRMIMPRPVDCMSEQEKEKVLESAVENLKTATAGTFY